MSLPDWEGQLNLLSYLLDKRVEERCRTASGLFAMDAGRVKRSLSQRLRRIREEEVRELRRADRVRRFSLTDPYLTKLWARKLFLQAMQPTIFERFHERRESRSGPEGGSERESVRGECRIVA